MRGAFQPLTCKVLFLVVESLMEEHFEVRLIRETTLSRKSAHAPVPFSGTKRLFKNFGMSIPPSSFFFLVREMGSRLRHKTHPYCR